VGRKTGTSTGWRPVSAFVRSRRASALRIAAVVLFYACGGSPKEAPAPAPPTESPVEATEKWRAKHDADYRRDWVSIAGLHLLKPGVNTVGSAKSSTIVVENIPQSLGRLVMTGDKVRFEPARGVEVRQRDQPVTGPVDFNTGQDQLSVGDVRLVMHLSGTRRSLRVRDPDGPLARGFKGFTWFPIDLQYRVVGRFIPDATPKPLKVPNTLGDEDEYRTEGVVEFQLQGQTLRLRPFTTKPKRFYIVFRDASSGQETYETARFLYADLRDDGTTVLDFNQAYNPPCAFNPYTTCPIPLKENRLPVKILAGEQDYKK
jgi:uncharacterized protein (DUF1684 family)